MFGYAKYAFIPQTRPWYEKGYFCFLDFLCNFRYKCLGMQSIRLPPQTRPWYEKGFFCYLDFLFQFPTKCFGM